MPSTIEILFWLAGGLIWYTYFGYAALISILSLLRPRMTMVGNIEPTVTLLIPAYNEEKVIAAKIENSLSLNYPPDKLKILVVADGSDDETAAISRRYSGVEVAFQPERRGKAAALNRVIPDVQTQIVLFSDANTFYAPDSLKAMVRHFADPAVGGVTGEKRVRGGGEGLYWRYESFLKGKDSRVSSVMGAAGEIFAMRRGAFLAPEEDSIIEDFVMSMRLVAQGWRVVYEPEAIAFEPASPSLVVDWDRRTRIAAGGFQSITRMPEMLDLRRGLMVWQYVSHRVLRWAVAPVLLPVILTTNILLWPKRIYRVFFFGQMAFYGLASLGFLQARRGRSRGLPGSAFYFVLANAAALAGLIRFLRRRQPVTWRKARR